jgi:myo-inositol-1(or 4)-monophosphatase
MHNKYLLNKILPILKLENKKISSKISFYSKNKNFFDPVTKFDLIIEKKIKKQIFKDFPNHNFIGEEFGEGLKKKYNNSETTWIVDPIDGTKALLCGQPTWSNLIGAKINNKMISSFAFFPELNKVYFTEKNKSYVLNNLKNKIINSSKVNNISEAKLITNSIHTLQKKNMMFFLKKYRNFFKITGSDAYNFCLMAEGKIDIIIEAGLKQVDILPLKKLLNNAGAIISDWRGDTDISSGNIVASSNIILHKKILKLIKLNKIV